MLEQSRKIVIIGLDGVGNAVKDAITPNLDSLIADGAVTYECQTVFPSISGECWGSLFHGVTPDKHLLNNDIVSSKVYPEDSAYPSFMKVAKGALPDIKLASFSSWNPINYGIIEDSTGCYKYSNFDNEMVPELVKFIKTSEFDILFVQLDDVDHAGHQHEYWSEKFYEQVRVTDTYVGDIINAIKEAGIYEDTLIIVTSDHGGGGEHPQNHGSADPKDMTIFLSCTGAGIKPRSEIFGKTSIMDIPAIVFKALGLQPHDNWRTNVAEELFKSIIS